MSDRITIKCSECGWEFTGSEYLTEVAFDEHCMEKHSDPEPKSEEEGDETAS